MTGALSSGAWPKDDNRAATYDLALADRIRELLLFESDAELEEWVRTGVTLARDLPPSDCTAKRR